MGCKARGARSGDSTRATSNVAAGPQSHFPYGFRRTGPEYIIASIGRGSRLVSKPVSPKRGSCGLLRWVLAANMHAAVQGLDNDTTVAIPFGEAEFQPW